MLHVLENQRDSTAIMQDHSKARHWAGHHAVQDFGKSKHIIFGYHHVREKVLRAEYNFNQKLSTCGTDAWFPTKPMSKKKLLEANKRDS